MTKLPHPTEKKKLFSSFSFKWAKPQEFLLFGLDLELSCPYFPIYHFPLSTFITSPEFSRRLRVSAKHLESLIINPSAAPQHSARRLSSFPSLQGLGKEENTHSSCYTEPFFAYWWEEPKNCYFSKGFWNLLSMGLTAVQPRMPATHSSVSHRTPASSKVAVQFCIVLYFCHQWMTVAVRLWDVGISMEATKIVEELWDQQWLEALPTPRLERGKLEIRVGRDQRKLESSRNHNHRSLEPPPEKRCQSQVGAGE